MKRQLNECQENTEEIKDLTPKKKSIRQKKVKRTEWTLEEDELLMQEVNKVKVPNWRVICKNLNKNFDKKLFTGEQCMQRWKILVPDHDMHLQWTSNEELLLLVMTYENSIDWLRISLLFNKPEGIKEYFKNIVLQIANRAKDHDYKDLNKINRLYILQVFAYVRLLLNAMSGKKCENPEVLEVIEMTKLEEADCFSLLNEVGKVIKAEGVWNRNRLDLYLENVMEKIRNKMIDLVVPQENIFSQQNQGPIPPVLSPFWVGPVNYMGREIYILAASNLQPYVPH